MKKLSKILCAALVLVWSTCMLAGCRIDNVPPPLTEKPDTDIENVQPDYWVESAYVNVFQDAQGTKNSAKKVIIDTALEERESTQIVLRSLTNFYINGVEFSDLVSVDDASDKIGKENLKYNYVEYYYFDSNSPGSVDSDLVRKGADFYPDALSNETVIRVSKQSAQPIWVTLYTPKGTPAGTYNGTAKVKTSSGDIVVDMDVTVYDVEIPASSEAEYSISFWNQVLGAGFGASYDDYHGSDTIAIKYGYERYSDAWWALVSDMADEMKENRLNSLQIHTVQLLADGGSIANSDGTYEFNWSKFDEYIQYFLDKGFVKRLNGYVMMAGANVNYLTYNSTSQKTITGQIAYTDQRAGAWLDAYVPALYEHLQEKGWLEMWFQNLKDEAKTADKPIYKFIYDKVRLHAPDMKVGDALDDTAMIDFMRGADSGYSEINVDVHIPLIDMHSANLTKYNSVKEDALVFSYTCVAPQGIQLNRFIDKPVWQGRSIAWYNYNTGVNGYLHWGLMAWYREIYEFANGDTATIYPDIKNNTIKSSIRMAAVRDGAEDYELLTMLERQELEKYTTENPDDEALEHFNPVSKQLAQIIARSSGSYTRDINLMIQVRIALLKALTGDFSVAKAIIENL